MPRYSPFVGDTVTASWTGSGSDGGIVVGTTIGKYEVRRVVGAGGAGVVLAAYDAELGRSVAIKFLVRESEDARARLMREAQAMAKLSHPNVVTVYEVLRVDERVAIVMELVDGRTLGEWQTEPRTWREIVGVYAQAARGLAAAHRAGLVHRDFKPANALIDDDGVVRVTDFGLVRAADDGAVDAAIDDEAGSELTQTGMVLGTPAYMAPEQHAGGVVDARTDQWALGCSLYGALYGERPFAGDKPSEIRASVLGDVPRTEPDTHVPKSIRSAIRRALSKEPTDRFATMDDFIHAITPRRRAWIAVAIAAGAGALAAGGIAFATAGRAVETCGGLDAPMRKAWNPVRAAILGERFAAAGVRTGERSIATLARYGNEWTDARVQACESNRRGESSPDLFDRKMSCLDQRLAEVGALTNALVAADRSGIEQARSAIANLHPVADCTEPRDTVPRPSDPTVRAEIERGEATFARAWAMGELNKFIEAKPLALEAVQIAERAGWAPLVARAQLQLGRSLSHEHDRPAAIVAFERAAAAAATGRDDYTLAEALAAKAFDLALGKPDDALAMKPYVELAIERAGRPPRPRAQWLHHLAAALFFKHRLDEALVAETEAVNVLRTIVAPDNAAMMDSLSLLSSIESERKNLDRAEQLLQQVLAIELESLGPDHPTVAGDYQNLGIVSQNRGDMLIALERFEHAIRIERAAGIDQWDTVVSLGIAQRETGRWREAVATLERAVAAADKQAPGKTMPVAACTVALATVFVDNGELARARPVLDRGVAAMRAIQSPNLPRGLGEQALWSLGAGKPSDARDAISAARHAAGERSSNVELADAGLAKLAGDWTRARAAYTQALEVAKTEPNQASITAANIGIAESDIALGKPAEAARRLDERLAWLETVHADPLAMARIRLVLARALVASNGDRTRAKGLAETARDAFGKTKQNEAADAARWIASTFGR